MTASLSDSIGRPKCRSPFVSFLIWIWSRNWNCSAFLPCRSQNQRGCLPQRLFFFHSCLGSCRVLCSCLGLWPCSRSACCVCSSPSNLARMFERTNDKQLCVGRRTANASGHPILETFWPTTTAKFSGHPFIEKVRALDDKIQTGGRLTSQHALNVPMSQCRMPALFPVCWNPGEA